MHHTMFDTLDADVLRHIVEELALKDGVYRTSLKTLSMTSRYIRSHCMPVLFRTCKGLSSVYGDQPPEVIRPYVRCVQFTIAFVSAAELHNHGVLLRSSYDDDSEAQTPEEPPFGTELDYFPNVQSIEFTYALGGVPWSALEKCLQYPGINAISMNYLSTWICTPPPPPSGGFPLQFRLAHFSYAPHEWRDLLSETTKMNYDAQAARNLETMNLRAIVLTLPETVQSLTLPVESAPLREMAAVDWPRLRTFSLVGQYTAAEQARAIPLTTAIGKLYRV
ncbi:hypothetical protein C8Q77DRAFT_1110107 [Trametes polyzona]|nr:hypothetical protein C8Q77DRAFT_1110107 [Trametes polyzona]